MKKLRYGMVGGGPGSFIGDAHRRAINLDGQAELLAGCPLYRRLWEAHLSARDSMEGGMERA